MESFSAATTSALQGSDCALVLRSAGEAVGEGTVG